MSIQIFSILLSVFLASSCDKEVAEIIQGNLAIAPMPASMQPGEGYYLLSEGASVIIDFPTDLSFDPLLVFMDVFEKKSGYPIAIDNTEKKKNSIVISFNDTIQNKEGYSLHISEGGIDIIASSAHGVFYALQTLRQIMRIDAVSDKAEIKRHWSLPHVDITDEPQFAYRGMHLDVVRHFMPASFVKKYIDLLAYYKMNNFHWHLTDDQGWRIEIKRYPKLQEVAAWRDETLIGHFRNKPQVYDGIRHGGYYTHEEVKDIVEYAGLRGVNIIPEIEMPGHARAALAAYPELACTAGPFTVATKWGIFKDVFCPTDTTFVFLQNVLDEVISLFPSHYIHIGGDECPKTRWEESAFCQELMQKEGLADEHELQSYFIKRIENYLNSKGRNIIGWDEILEGGLAPNATVMSWRGVKGGIAAAEQDHDVVMSPGPPCYFDHYQADPATEPVAIGGMSTVENVYAFQPVPPALSSTQAHHILGAQGNVWTEYILEPSHVEYMAYPRAVALAEVLWTPPAKRNYQEFKERFSHHAERLDGMDVNYAKHIINQ